MDLTHQRVMPLEEQVEEEASLGLPTKNITLKMAWPGCKFYHPLQRACNHHANKEAKYLMEKLAILKILYCHTDKPPLNVSSLIAGAIQPLLSNSSLFLHIPCSSANCVVWHFWGRHEQMSIHPRWGTDNKPKKLFYTSGLVEQWAGWGCVHKHGWGVT